MSDAVRPAQPSPTRAVRRSVPITRPAEGDADGPSPARPPGLPAAPALRSPRERLVGLGVGEQTARALVARYGCERVIDALDAVDTLGDGEVRRRAGWVVSAIRQGWDLDAILAERRQIEARNSRWERERDERDRQAARWRSRESAVGVWYAAISATLDDRQLAVAVERVTTPVAGLGRRSVPIVRAQLLAWAVTAHRDAPDQPLADVLADDLVGVDRNIGATSLEGPLPPVPTDLQCLEDDLTARLTDLFARRSDLSHPGRPPRECADDARGRALVQGVGHER